jgi:hypothetical protein
MIGEQLQKLMASREAAVQDAASKDVGGAGAAVEAGKAPAPAPGASSAGGAAIASSVAAIGIAIGFLSTAVASLLGAVTGLPLWKTALGLVGLLLLVSGPSVIIAYFRLRQRDLAPVLNASGWAINARLNINPKLGGKLTHLPMLPKGSTRELRDPYAEPTARRNTLIALLVIAGVLCGLYYFGVLDPIIDHVMRLLKPSAPPAPPPP